MHARSVPRTVPVLDRSYPCCYGLGGIARYDANTGFFLNEQHFKVRGFCDHNDLAVVGMVSISIVQQAFALHTGHSPWHQYHLATAHAHAQYIPRNHLVPAGQGDRCSTPLNARTQAVPDRLKLFRAQASRSVGGNGRRTSHNPPDKRMLEIYDRVGIVARQSQFMNQNDATSGFEMYLAPTTCGAGGPDQNASRIQHTGKAV